MALPIISLDDRDFDQLYKEAVRMIPRYCPQWTDHNPSDPGIILTELFALLMDVCIYQIDQIPEATMSHFASMLGYATLQEAIESLNTVTQAVSEKDYESIVLREYEDKIARVLVDNTPSGLNIVIVPLDYDQVYLPPSAHLCESVYATLKEKCAVTSRFKVTGADFTDIQIICEIVRDTYSLISISEVQQKITSALRSFLDPICGGLDEKGWPFGKPVYRSELYKVLEDIAGVDHVSRLELNQSSSTSQVLLVSQKSLVHCLDIHAKILDPEKNLKRR